MHLVLHLYPVPGLLLSQLRQHRNLLQFHIVILLRQVPLCRDADRLPLLRIDRAGVADHAAGDTRRLLR